MSAGLPLKKFGFPSRPLDVKPAVKSAVKSKLPGVKSVVEFKSNKVKSNSRKANQVPPLPIVKKFLKRRLPILKVKSNKKGVIRVTLGGVELAVEDLEIKFGVTQNVIVNMTVYADPDIELPMEIN